jgi:hypothetical protein
MLPGQSNRIHRWSVGSRLEQHLLHGPLNRFPDFLS